MIPNCLESFFSFYTTHHCQHCRCLCLYSFLFLLSFLLFFIKKKIIIQHSLLIHPEYKHTYHMCMCVYILGAFGCSVHDCISTCHVHLTLCHCFLLFMSLSQCKFISWKSFYSASFVNLLTTFTENRLLAPPSFTDFNKWRPKKVHLYFKDWADCQELAKAIKEPSAGCWWHACFACEREDVY